MFTDKKKKIAQTDNAKHPYPQTPPPPLSKIKDIFRLTARTKRPSM